MAYRRLIVLVPVLMLTACAMPSMPDFLSLPDFPSLPSFSSEGPATADDVDCGTATRLDLAALDWDGAKRVDMYARASGVSPATLVMTVNTPNIIRLYNATRDVWTFRAEEFFKQAAIVRIIYGGKDVSETCIEAIRIGPLKWAEVRVVPLRQGEFYFRDEAPSRLMSLFGDEDPAPPGHIIVR